MPLTKQETLEIFDTATAMQPRLEELYHDSGLATRKK